MHTSPRVPARMIALGSAALMEGFALVGFETHVDPSPEAIEKLLLELLDKRQAALVVIEQSLAQRSDRHLLRAQRASGRIVITEIPAIQLSGSYHSRLESLVRSALGSASLETRQ